MKSITWKAWLAVGFAAALATSLALAPVWLGYFNTGPDEVFTSAGRDDEYVYLAWVREAKEGNWLFDNPYTLEPHRRLYLNPLFLLMGKTARVFNLGPFLVFNIFRVIAGVVLTAAVYLFLRTMIRSPGWLFGALLVTLFTGGVGYFSYAKPPILRDPRDIFMASRMITEARSLPSILFYPQGPFSVTLLLALWVLFFELRKRFAWRIFLLSLVAGNLLVAIHPYDLLLALVAPLIFLFLEPPLTRDDLVALGVLAFSLLPVSLYFVSVARMDEVYRAWTRIRQLSPPLSQWLIIYAPLLPLSLIGLFAYVKRERPDWLGERARLVVIWFGLLPFLVYLPVNFQRRLSEGAYLPVGFLAVLGIWWLSRRFSRAGAALALALVVISLPDYPFQAYERIRVLREDFWGGYYTPAGKLQAWSWLDRHSQEKEAVLALPDEGLYLPVFTGNKVYYGHWANTVNSAAKWERLMRVFRPSVAPYFRRRLSRRTGASFVFAPKEPPPPVKGLLVPWGDPALPGVFENDAVAIFQTGLTPPPPIREEKDARR
jgi:hypothetical protein